MEIPKRYLSQDQLTALTQAVTRLKVLNFSTCSKPNSWRLYTVRDITQSRLCCWMESCDILPGHVCSQQLGLCLGLSIVKPCEAFTLIHIWHPRVPTIGLDVKNDDSNEGPVITALSMASKHGWRLDGVPTICTVFVLHFNSNSNTYQVNPQSTVVNHHPDLPTHTATASVVPIHIARSFRFEAFRVTSPDACFMISCMLTCLLLEFYSIM